MGANHTDPLEDWARTMSNVRPLPPPPGTLSPVSTGASTGLPAPLTSLLGRDAELDSVLKLLDRDDLRLVTLLGPGGVGKTRLAQEVMRRASGDFLHGAHFVPLAPVRNGSLVPIAVAQALGIHDSGTLPINQVLTAWLAARHLLLVLDNLEQVVEAAAPWLSELLASCPRLTVLATSRIALDITGEQRYRVPPLPVPDPAGTDRLDDYAAIMLFVRQAQAVQSGFGLDAGNREAIVGICTRLDGLPLAIELAAVRVNVLSPAEILARLTDRLTLLTSHGRDVPPRLRSMRDAIGWSYDLLSVAERDLHARLAVFVGSFALDAAEAVASRSPHRADGWNVTDLVARLIDHSLVEQIGGAQETRYRLLETIREYGLAHLAEQDDLDVARDAHAAYYQQLAARAEAGLKGPDQVRWLNRLDTELGNLREALAWLTATDRVPDAIEIAHNIDHFMHVRAHFTEWALLLERWFALPELHYRTRTRALALLADGLRAANVYDPTPAIRSLEEALEIFRELDDHQNIVFSLTVLSFAYWTANDLVQARRANNECLPLATRLGDARDQALAVTVLANIVWHEGDPERARQLLEEALAMARQASDQWVMGITLGMLGRLALDAGHDLGAAATLLNEARTIQEELGDQRNLPVEHTDLALIARIQGNFDTAESHLQAGLAITQATGQVIAEAVFHIELSIVARLRGELERSVRELRQAVYLLRQAHYLPDLAECLRTFAALALASGDALAAARFLCGADALLRDIRLPRAKWTTDEHARLVESVRAVLGHEAFDRASREVEGWSVDDAVAATLAFELPADVGKPGKANPTHGLSPRELDVLRLMATGLSNQQIADELFVSHRTVTSHVTNILGKLGLTSRTAAVAFAIRHDIV